MKGETLPKTLLDNPITSKITEISFFSLPIRKKAKELKQLHKDIRLHKPAKNKVERKFYELDKEQISIIKEKGKISIENFFGQFLYRQFFFVQFLYRNY